MRIGIDLDGVLADFNSRFVSEVVRVTGRDVFPKDDPDFPSCWNYPEHYGYTVGEVHQVWASIKADPLFWLSLKPLPETRLVQQVTRRRWQEDDVYFLTARPGIQAKRQSEVWLSQQGFFHPTVILSAAKGLMAQGMGLDVHIDDRVENHEDVRHWSPRTRSYLIARPWNVCKDPQRMPSIEAVLRQEEML